MEKKKKKELKPDVTNINKNGCNETLRAIQIHYK